MATRTATAGISHPPTDPYTEQEARRIARLNILMTLGNALHVADMQLCADAAEPFWRAVIAHGETEERVGELHIPAQKGEAVSWHPDAAAPEVQTPKGR